MTSVNQTAWICDRCHAKDVADLLGKPESWVLLRVTEAMMVDPESVSSKINRHLCGDCWADLAQWVAMIGYHDPSRRR